MEFLREQELKGQDRESKLIQEKKTLEERVKQLEEELQKQLIINQEMAKKLKIVDAKKVVKNLTNNTGTIL